MNPIGQTSFAEGDDQFPRLTIRPIQDGDLTERAHQTVGFEADDLIRNVGGFLLLIRSREEHGPDGHTVLSVAGEVGLDAEASGLLNDLYNDVEVDESRLARLLCEQGPDCIREMDEWGVGWARKDGHITATMAPGGAALSLGPVVAGSTATPPSATFTLTNTGCLPMALSNAFFARVTNAANLSGVDDSRYFSLRLIPASGAEIPLPTTPNPDRNAAQPIAINRTLQSGEQLRFRVLLEMECLWR